MIPVAYGEGLADRIRAAASHCVDAFIDTFGEEYVRLALELGIPKERIETIIASQAPRRTASKLRSIPLPRVPRCSPRWQTSSRPVGLVDGLAHGDRLIVAAFMPGSSEVTAVPLLTGARSMSGWVGGYPKGALEFSVLAGVRPKVEEFPLDHAATAYQRMIDSTVRFRAVLRP